jgi:hypothetical protein
MRRAFYHGMLWLHPPGFRRRFAAEMSCVFDEAEREGQTAGFCASITMSLVRKWIWNPFLWRVAGAIAGGVFTLLCSAVSRGLRLQTKASPSGDTLIVLTVGVLIAILATLIVTVTLFQTLRRRRI